MLLLLLFIVVVVVVVPNDDDGDDMLQVLLLLWQAIMRLALHKLKVLYFVVSIFLDLVMGIQQLNEILK